MEEKTWTQPTSWEDSSWGGLTWKCQVTDKHKYKDKGKHRDNDKNKRKDTHKDFECWWLARPCQVAEHRAGLPYSCLGGQTHHWPQSLLLLLLLSLSLSLSWWGRSSVSPARKATACRCSPGLQLPRGQTHTLNCCCCFCLHFLSSKIVLSKMSSWCNILNSLFDHVWSNLLMVKWHCCSSSGLNCLFQIEISLSFNILPSPAESSFLLALNALRRRRGSLPHQSRNTSASVF